MDNSIEAINEYFNLIKNILKDKEIDPNNNNCEINIEDIINFSFKFDCNGPYDCSKFDSSNEKCIHSIIHDNKCDYEVLFIIDNNLEINFLSSICESNSESYSKDFNETNSTDNNNNKLVNIYTEYKNCSGLNFFLGLCRFNNTQNEPITDYNNRKNCSVLRFVLGLCPPNNTNNNNLINIYTDNKNCSGLKQFLGLCKTDNINNEKITNHNNCTGLRFFLGLCIPNNTNNDEITDYINHILDQIDKNLFNNIFRYVIEQNVNFIQKDNNVIYQLSSISSQYLTNLSKISLEECESFLKEYHSMNESEKLILFKIEYNIEKTKIPIIEYQLFTKDGEKLNLSECYDNDEDVNISIPVDINEDEEFIYNPNSDFYQDKCFTYTSEYETDLTIYDRKINYNKKYLSLCEKDCEYMGYINLNQSSKCKCKIKKIFPKLTTEKYKIKDLINQFTDVKMMFFNLFVLTCHKVLFSSEGLKKNSGNYINIIIIVCIIIYTILFWITRYRAFIKKIIIILNANISNNNNEQNETENKIDISNTTTNNNRQGLGLNHRIQISESKTNINQKNTFNDYEKNDFNYDEALLYDKRSFCGYYWSLIKTKQIFFFTYCVDNDYNSKEIKRCLFLFWLSLDYTMNALFFNESTLHKIYEDKGKYNFFYQLIKTFYAFLISFVIMKIVTLFSITEDNIAKIKKDSKIKKNPKIEDKKIKYIHSLKLKYIIFFICMILILLFFWYYLSSFCAVFINTQVTLIINTLVGYVDSLVYLVIISFIICCLRYCSLKAKKKNKKYLYKFSKFLSEYLI